MNPHRLFLAFMRLPLRFLFRSRSSVAILAFFLLAMRTLAAATFPEVSQLPAQTVPPDPLTLFNGEHVTSIEQWSNQRRPELQALFQHYMYGYPPPSPARIESTVERADKKF